MERLRFILWSPQALLSWTPDPWRVHICKTSLKPSKVHKYIHNNNNIKPMNWVETCGHSQLEKQYCVYSLGHPGFSMCARQTVAIGLKRCWKKTNKRPVTAIAANNRTHCMALRVCELGLCTQSYFFPVFFFFFIDMSYLCRKLFLETQSSCKKKTHSWNSLIHNPGHRAISQNVHTATPTHTSPANICNLLGTCKRYTWEYAARRA